MASTKGADYPLETALRKIGGQLVKGAFVRNNSPQGYHPETFRYVVVAADTNPETINGIHGNTKAEIARACNAVIRNQVLCYGGTHFD